MDEDDDDNDGKRSVCVCVLFHRNHDDIFFSLNLFLIFYFFGFVIKIVVQSMVKWFDLCSCSCSCARLDAGPNVIDDQFRDGNWATQSLTHSFIHLFIQAVALRTIE